MHSAAESTPQTEFDNVQVTAIPKMDPSGKVTYTTTFDPPSVEITTYDSVLNYQLIAPTPAGVKFSHVSISPKHTHQLSTPSISCSGKMVTFSDANTVAEKLALTFHFIDDAGVTFSVDPEIDNVPPPDPPMQ